MKASIGLITVMLIIMSLTLTKNSFATAEESGGVPIETSSNKNKNSCNTLIEMSCENIDYLASISDNGKVPETTDSALKKEEIIRAMQVMSQDCLYAIYEYACPLEPTPIDEVKRKIFLDCLSSTDSEDAVHLKSYLIEQNLVTHDEAVAMVNE